MGNMGRAIGTTNRFCNVHFLTSRPLSIREEMIGGSSCISGAPSREIYARDFLREEPPGRNVAPGRTMMNVRAGIARFRSTAARGTRDID